MLKKKYLLCKINAFLNISFGITNAYTLPSYIGRILFCSCTFKATQTPANVFM